MTPSDETKMQKMATLDFFYTGTDGKVDCFYFSSQAHEVVNHSHVLYNIKCTFAQVKKKAMS